MSSNDLHHVGKESEKHIMFEMCKRSEILRESTNSKKNEEWTASEIKELDDLFEMMKPIVMNFIYEDLTVEDSKLNCH